MSLDNPAACSFGERDVARERPDLFVRWSGTTSLQVDVRREAQLCGDRLSRRGEVKASLASSISSLLSKNRHVETRMGSYIRRNVVGGMMCLRQRF